MADIDEYTVLRGRWQEAHQRARQARLRCTQAFAECAAGKGTGATVQQLDEADQLERQADALAIELDQMVHRMVPYR